MVSPHPVQPNSEFPGHGHFGNSFFPAHHQVHILTPPVRVAPCGCLCCFHQQEAQQRIALLADVSQPLFAGTGVFARNESGVAADLLAAGNLFLAAGVYGMALFRHVLQNPIVLIVAAIPALFAVMGVLILIREVQLFRGR